MTALPQYYEDDEPPFDDTSPDRHVATLAAAIETIAGRPDVDADRVGLVGFSLGAAIAMTYSQAFRINLIANG